MQQDQFGSEPFTAPAAVSDSEPSQIEGQCSTEQLQQTRLFAVWLCALRNLPMMAEPAAVADWLGASGLPPSLLPALEAHGAEGTQDLAWLELAEIDELCEQQQLTVAEQSKLRQALRLVRIAAGAEEPASASDAARQRRAAPLVPRLGAAEAEQHVATLQRYASQSNAAPADLASVIGSLHASWAGCVADPTLRSRVLPVLFAIAKRANASAVEREAALALVFLSFSLSGTVIRTDAPPPQHASPPPSGSRRVVIIMGWLGSSNEEFATLSQHYRKLYPGCTVLTTVGGSDCWADSPAAAQQEKQQQQAVPLFADGCTEAPWPTSALCEEHLWHLAEAILPPATACGGSAGGSAGDPAPRVLFHCFSNGFTLYVRLLRHLQQRGLEGEVECTDVLARISGVIFDSTPAWGPPPAVIPPPPIVKLVASQAVAAVLKKESVAGMSMRRDIGPNTPLKAVVESTCARSQDTAFDSTWHYDWAREHEPPVPCLFVYSAVDRTTRQEAIEQWLVGNKERWESCGRNVSTLLLPNTSHCMHWFKARAKYEAAISGLVAKTTWLED
jgi:hypothetical protein